MSLYAEPVIGYRVWRVRGSRLCGYFKQGALWPDEPGEPMVARCPTCDYLRDAGHRETGSPGRQHSCGVHAYYRVEQLGAHGYVMEAKGMLQGAVACWGTVVPHINAFRCEKAIPVALFGSTEMARAVARRIEVPLFDPGDEFGLCAEAARYGPEVHPDRIPGSLEATVQFEKWLYGDGCRQMFATFSASIKDFKIASKKVEEQAWKAVEKFTRAATANLSESGPPAS